MNVTKETERKCCHEVGNPASTLKTVLCGHDYPAWTVMCTVCKRWTELCLTVDEALERARREWWAA